MTAGTVVITGGILATVILLCIIAVLCYCRLQVRLGWGGCGPEGCCNGEGTCGQPSVPCLPVPRAGMHGAAPSVAGWAVWDAG